MLLLCVCGCVHIRQSCRYGQSHGVGSGLKQLTTCDQSLSCDCAIQYQPAPQAIYRIAGKFGEKYVWRKGLQAAKNKYWRNLNLAIGNRAEVRTWFDCSAKTEVEVMEESQLESCV